MTWKKAKAEAVRLVELTARNHSELRLTEYQSRGLLPGRLSKRPSDGDHNLIVKAAMCEASWRGIYVHRRLVK
jgi:hypothetical protein